MTLIPVAKVGSTAVDAQKVQILDGSGNQVTSFGGGTQYTEGDTDASITGTAMLMEGAANALVPAQGTAADGLLVNLGANNDVTVTGSVTANAGTNLNTSALALETTATSIKTAAELLDDTVYTDGTGTVTKGIAILGQDGTNPQAIKTDSSGELQVDVLTMPAVTVTGVATAANQTTQITAEQAIQTAVELIDDSVATLGTTTYTEATTKGLTIGAVRRDADTTLVNTTNEIGPLQMDANGRLKVEVFSGEALPVTDNSASLSVDWNGTTPVTGSGTATGALRVELPTNGTGVLATVTTVSTVSALGAGTTGPMKAEDVASAAGDQGVAIMAARLDTPVANAGVSNDGDYTTPILDNYRKVWVTGTVPEDTAHVAGEAITVMGARRIDTAATSAGSSADWATVDASAEGALWTTLTPTTTSGLSVANFTSGDTYTALTNSAQVIKASAGNLYGYYIGNPNASAVYVLVYNIAAASVTVGTSTATLVFYIPASSAANLTFPYPISFGTAMSCAATTTGGGNTAPATALEVMFYYK